MDSMYRENYGGICAHDNFERFFSLREGERIKSPLNIFKGDLLHPD